MDNKRVTSTHQKRKRTPRISRRSSQLQRTEWGEMIGDHNLCPLPEVSDTAYAKVSNAAIFDDFISATDLRVYCYLCHWAGVFQSNVVHNIKATKIAELLKTHRVTVVCSLKSLCDRRHITKISTGTYRLNTKIFSTNWGENPAK